MTVNSDILLGYFDSLLAPCPVDESGEHPMDSLLADAIAPFAAETDTIAEGYRLISLMSPGSNHSRPADFTLNLELLMTVRKLGDGRLRQAIFDACEPESFHG